MLPYEDNKYLIDIDNRGFFVWDPSATDTSKILTKDYFNKKELAKTEAFFLKNQLYLGAAYLGNDLYALSTINSGVVIMNKKGKIVNIIDKEHNLLSQTVHFLFTDNKKQLWAGLTYGISYIEINSPLQSFDSKFGLQGSIYSAFRQNNNFYATSNLGLYYWKDNKFNGVPEFTGENSLQVFNPSTFKYPDTNKNLTVISTITGIYKVNNYKIKLLLPLSPNIYFQSRYDSSTIWMSNDYAIYKASLNNNLTNPEIFKLNFYH